MLAEYIKSECGHDYKDRIMDISSIMVQQQCYSIRWHDKIYERMLDAELGNNRNIIDTNRYIQHIDHIISHYSSPLSNLHGVEMFFKLFFGEYRPL